MIVFDLIENRRERLKRIAEDVNKKVYRYKNLVDIFEDYLIAMDDNWDADLEMIDRFKHAI